ncbi:glycerate kinase type-2 family protein [Martelella radicis]|uniref:Hydroxypyruvate reductase/glycerate 2-kinase n=1 Tax=Martelella radicis TaxID=1397476 RepID=A0A7W6KL79_9HYPH|nr:glycerate kinase [Martelella radicis]MBB4121880.1 hydroxypyruvate reductase/glycerate 2-kinase [Martelella radicis]
MQFDDEPGSFLRSLFDVAVAAADPMEQVSKYLPEPPKGRTVVVGAGKGSARMAEALEACWLGPLEGVVVTRYGHEAPCEKIEILSASHPVPDEAGERAARRILEAVSDLSEDDLVIVLISGGGSALLSLPPQGLTLQDKISVNKALLRCGASIDEVNCVRKHLSAIKGGRLAAAIHPARCHTLLISDVPGDDPAIIASGPTVGETTTAEDAKAIIRRYRIDLPDHVAQHLDSPLAECVTPDDSRLARTENHIIATPLMSLEAAADKARAAGLNVLVLGDTIEGEASEVGVVHAGIAEAIRHHGIPVARPALVLSGGETSVTVKGDGRGGRNVEFLLSLAVHLNGLDGVHALSGDTDGVDGREEIAGAVITPDTLKRAREAGIDARALLENNDGHGFFEALGDQVITGPTLTNVNDFRAILIL